MIAAKSLEQVQHINITVLMNVSLTFLTNSMKIQGNEEDCICEKPNEKHRKHCNVYRLEQFLIKVARTTMSKEISLYEIVKGRKLLSKEGIPLTSRAAVLNRIRTFPSCAQRLNAKGVRAWYISIEDLEGWNLPLKKKYDPS